MYTCNDFFFTAMKHYLWQLQVSFKLAVIANELSCYQYTTVYNRALYSQHANQKDCSVIAILGRIQLLKTVEILTILEKAIFIVYWMMNNGPASGAGEVCPL